MSFTIENKIENGFATVVLIDNESKTSAVIIPSCGAILHAFEVFHNGESLNVIDQYDGAEDFAKNVSSKGFKSCKLSPFACRVKNATYSFEGREFTIEKFLLGDSALHGLLYDADFLVTDSFADAEQASVTMKYHYSGSDNGYPFHYSCSINYQLKKDNLLTLTTEITNNDESAIPMQDGWHPYFTFGGKVDDLLLEFQSAEKMLFDAAMIPTGEKKPYEEFGALKKIGDTRFDDCFSLNFATCQPLCVLRDSNKKLQIEIRPEKSYPYLQIYTPDHRNSIAIENLSAIPDTFNNRIGLSVLQPKEKATFTASYKITPLT